MPPKAKTSAPANAALANVSDDQKAKDAIFIFENLFNVTTAIVFNVAEIAQQTGAKTNSVAKRFNVIRNRYQGLNLATTTVGGGGGAAVMTVPPTPKAKKTAVANGSKGGTRGRKKAAAKVKENHEDVEDETNGADDDDDGDEDYEEGTQSGHGKAPATPVGNATDHNLADDEQSVKKPRAKPATKKGNKSNGATANIKRKRVDDASDDQSVKRAKGVNGKKSTKKAKEQDVIDKDISEDSSNADVDQEKDQEEESQDQDQVGKHKASLKSNIVSLQSVATPSRQLVPQHPFVEQIADEQAGGIDINADTSLVSIEKYVEQLTGVKSQPLNEPDVEIAAVDQATDYMADVDSANEATQVQSQEQDVDDDDGSMLGVDHDTAMEEPSSDHGENAEDEELSGDQGESAEDEDAAADNINDVNGIEDAADDVDDVDNAEDAAEDAADGTTCDIVNANITEQAVAVPEPVAVSA